MEKISIIALLIPLLSITCASSRYVSEDFLEDMLVPANISKDHRHRRSEPEHEGSDVRDIPPIADDLSPYMERMVAAPYHEETEHHNVDHMADIETLQDEGSGDAEAPKTAAVMSHGSEVLISPEDGIEDVLKELADDKEDHNKHENSLSDVLVSSENLPVSVDHAEYSDPKAIDLGDSDDDGSGSSPLDVGVIGHHEEAGKELEKESTDAPEGIHDTIDHHEEVNKESAESINEHEKESTDSPIDQHDINIDHHEEVNKESSESLHEHEKESTETPEIMAIPEEKTTINHLDTPANQTDNTVLSPVVVDSVSVEPTEESATPADVEMLPVDHGSSDKFEKIIVPEISPESTTESSAELEPIIAHTDPTEVDQEPTEAHIVLPDISSTIETPTVSQETHATESALPERIILFSSTSEAPVEESTSVSTEPAVPIIPDSSSTSTTEEIDTVAAFEEEEEEEEDEDEEEAVPIMPRFEISSSVAPETSTTSSTETSSSNIIEHDVPIEPTKAALDVSTDEPTSSIPPVETIESNPASNNTLEDLKRDEMTLLSNTEPELVIAGSDQKQLAVYVLVGFAGICLIIIVAFLLMRRRRSFRRTIDMESSQDKDTEKALLSLGKFRDDSEDNHIKNNEITPLVIKQSSQINKFEKNPNFSSAKNLNTIANEKNLEKDNVFKETQAIIDEEDDAKKSATEETKSTIDDKLDDENKPMLSENVTPEKHIVRARLDQDSIPKKPIIVTRNGNGYHSVAQDPV